MKNNKHYRLDNNLKIEIAVISILTLTQDHTKLATGVWDKNTVNSTSFDYPIKKQQKLKLMRQECQKNILK